MPSTNSRNPRAVGVGNPNAPGQVTPADTTPNAFSFTAVTGAGRSALVESNAITVAGINAETTISVVGGEYSIDGGSYTSASGTVSLNVVVMVRLTTSSSYSTAASATLTIGGVSATFTATTLAEPVSSPPPVGDTVSLLAEINASNGGTISVAEGSYGRLSLLNLKPASKVTIIAADAQAPPVIAGIALKSCSNFRFEGLEITPSGSPLYGVSIVSCADVEVVDCNIRGPASDAYADDCHGVFIRSSQRVTVSGSDFKWMEFGLAHLDCDDVTVTGCDFHEIQTDGVRGGGTRDLTISRNRFYDFYPLAADHPDAIQIWTGNVSRLTTGLLIEDNLIYRGDGRIMQGIFIRDQGATGYDGITVRRNAVVGGMPNGIAISGVTPSPLAKNVTVSDNFILGYVGDRSWLRLSATTGAVWTDNQYSYVAHDPDNNVSLTDGGGNVKLAESTAVGDLTALNAWRATRTNVPAPV